MLEPNISAGSPAEARKGWCWQHADIRHMRAGVAVLTHALLKSGVIRSLPGIVLFLCSCGQFLCSCWGGPWRAWRRLPCGWSGERWLLGTCMGCCILCARFAAASLRLPLLVVVNKGGHQALKGFAEDTAVLRGHACDRGQEGPPPVSGRRRGLLAGRRGP